MASRCLGRSGLKQTTKTHEARFIPMNTNIKAIMDKLHKTKINDSFVFCKRDGSHLDYNHVTERYFTKSQVELGLSKVIHFHDLPPHVRKSFYDERREYLYASEATRS